MSRNPTYPSPITRLPSLLTRLTCSVLHRHWLEVSKPHHYLGEACGFLTWLWIFYRAKQDLPVVLGWRHPWEHAEDPWKIVDHVDDLEGLEKSWDEVSLISAKWRFTMGKLG